MISKIIGIISKNILIEKRNKMKLFGYIVSPILVSLLTILLWNFNHTYQFDILWNLLSIILIMQLAMLGTNFCRQVTTHFIIQRVELFKQYQLIMGLPLSAYLIGHIIYYWLLIFTFLSPVMIVNCYYYTTIYYITVFLFGSLNLTLFSLFYSHYFNDHKIAGSLIGFSFLLTSFLPFAYSSGRYYLQDILTIIFPNSLLAVTVFQPSYQKIFYSLVMSLFYLLLYLLSSNFQKIVKLIKRCKCCNIFKKINKDQKQNQIQLISQGGIQSFPGINIQNINYAIQIINLCKQYNGFKALNNINLKIKCGIIFGLLGRNGAGKTTIIDIITKVTQQNLGKIIIHNSSNIGICYQKQILYSNLTVQEHLNFYNIIKGSNNSIQDTIIALGIDNQRYKKSQQLSGGNKRKLSIGIAILGNSPIIIFDQPTSGLDPFSRRQIWQILKSLKNLNTSVILTTHHLDQAEYLADYISIIQKGQIIAQGTVNQIKQQYGQGYYLIINTDIQNKIQQCLQILNKYKQLKKIQSDKTYLRYFISNYNQQILSKVIFYLGNIKDLQISLASNTLQQSFVSLVKQVNQNQQNYQDQQRSIIKSKFILKLYAIFLRSFYNTKASFISLTFLYNINIFLLFLYQVFARLIQSSSNQNIQPQYLQTAILQGYLVMSNVYIFLPTLQKQKKIINLMRARSLKSLQYWLGNFIYDYTLFLINYSLICLLGIFQLASPTNWDTTLLTGISMILFSYICSFFFNKVKTAANCFGIINTLFGLLIMPLIIVGKDTYFQNFTWIKYLYPYYQLGNSIFLREADIGNTSFIFKISLYIGLIIIIQSKLISRIKNRQQQKINQNNICFQNVSHFYGKIQALDNISFTVNQERFALLGQNGAGKSTTFQILSSQLSPTSGIVFIQKKEKKSYKQSLQHTGVCYQDDTLWENLTPNEIIKIFCLIIGIEKIEIQKRWLFNSLDFQYCQKRFSQLSGGNKRKLCTAIAFLGQPQIRLLDQCSTGLDPSSRDCLLTTIKSSKKGVTVFSTHSMSQAQQLCSKLLILKKGKIQSYGNIYNLRNHYFSCYLLEISFEDNSITQQIVNKKLQFKFKYKISLTQSYFKLQISKLQITLSQLFNKMFQLKKQQIVKQFRIFQPRLQDIFLKIMQEQINN